MTPEQTRAVVGAEVTLPPAAWLHSDGTLQIRVLRVMNELNRYNHDKVWIEGTRRNARPDRGKFIQALVRVDALLDALDRTVVDDPVLE